MGVRLLAVVICAVGSCSLFDVKLGAQNIKGSYTVNSALGGGCGDATSAFKDVDLPGGDLLKGGSFDASIACLKSAKFTLSSTLDSLATSANAAETCTGPAGIITLDSYDISYEYKDSGAT